MYSLFKAVQAFPIQFSVAAAVAWELLGLVALALLAQAWVRVLVRPAATRVIAGVSAVEAS
ncbi:MAG: hypothetical protein ACYDCS_08785 [Candidatus Dormibacteria bacterium]